MEGIDVYSKYQTVQNWNSVRAADVVWCYQKVSDGTTTRTVQSPAAGRAAGVLQGGYHFSQPGNPVEQANLLVDRCTSLGMLDLNPALDLEDNPPGVGSNIPDSQKADWAIAFGRQVLARGHGFTLYAGDNVWNFVRVKVMNALPQTFRWVARYRSAPPDNPYDAWQYTSSGSVPGISGSIDRSKGKVPNNHGGADMPLDDNDINKIMQAFFNWKDRSNRNLVDQGQQNGWWLQGAIQSIADLRNLIIADDANDVTAEGVAEALRGILVSEVAPAVSDSVRQAITDGTLHVDAEVTDEAILKVANSVADTLHNRLLD